jgi:hypothetical protein
MERKSLDGLPTIVADMESLRQQLRELHAAVKAKVGERREQADTVTGVGMVIKGK